MGGFKKAFLLFVLASLPVLIYVPGLFALDPDCSIDQYVPVKFFGTDRVTGNTIYSISQDPDGYIWLASKKGLYRYDGAYFWPMHRRLNPPQSGKNIKAKEKIDNDIFSTVFTDKQGNLWVGGINLLASFLPGTQEFKVFHKNGDEPGGSVSCFAEDIRGNLWIGYHRGRLKRFVNGKFTGFELPCSLREQESKVVSILEDRNDNLIAVTLEDGVFLFRGGQFVPDDIIAPGTRVKKAFKDRDGVLWFGTSQGLTRFSENKKQIFDTADGLSNENIFDIAQDNGGQLWIATYNGLNRLKESWDGTVSFENSLGNHVVTCLFQGKEGGLWAGTAESGFIRLKDPVFVNHSSVDHDPGKTIYSVFVDSNGDTWTGANQGRIYCYRDGEIVETLGLPFDNSNPGTVIGNVTAIEEDKEGHFWFGTSRGRVFRWNPGAAGVTPYDAYKGLVDNYVLCITCDSSGRLWFCAKNGLTRFQNGKFKRFDDPKLLLGKSAFSACEDQRQNIWVLNSRGINCFEKGKIEPRYMKAYKTRTAVSHMFEDTGAPGSGGPAYWFTTFEDGLMRLQNEKMTYCSFKQGMCSTKLFKVFGDDWGNLWMFGDKGVYRVGKNMFNQFARGEIKRVHCSLYGKKDGMISNQLHNAFSPNSAAKTPGGGLLFVTRKGITVFNPGKLKINRTPPPVYVVDIILSHRQRRHLNTKEARDLVFDHHKTVGFFYSSPAFSSHENLKFEYKLTRGESGEIVPYITGKRVVHYQNLPTGDYTFHVKACSRDGVWNEKGAIVSFTLIPCFTETFLYKALIALGVLLLAAAGFLLWKRRSPRETKSKHTAKSSAKYKNSYLPPDYVDLCLKKIDYMMNVEKIYRDENLSLHSLARKLAVTPHQLSRMINETLHKNFPDLVNSYRIDEVKKDLSNPAKSRVKILSIAFQAGFKTKVAFNATFKKYTGMTPTEYREKMKRKML